MRKNRISILLAMLLCLTVFPVAGCTPAESVQTITDIAAYSDMQSGGDKIVVDFENGTRYGFQFSIEDKAEIDEIVSLVLTTSLMDASDAPVAPGNNTNFTIYQGIRTYGIAFSGVTLDDNRYVFSTNDIEDKITAIAKEKGAFDTQVGLLYKIIDLNSIESIRDENVPVSDQAELLKLIDSDYGDCKYFFVYDRENLAEPYSFGLEASESNPRSYKDTVEITQDQLLVIYRIYQKFDTLSYYLQKPSIDQYSIGNPVTAEFTFGLWHPYHLEITILS